MIDLVLINYHKHSVLQFVIFRPVDPYGFVRDDNFDYKTYEEFESEYSAVLSRRSRRWKEAMKKDKFRHDRKSMS